MLSQKKNTQRPVYFSALNLPCRKSPTGKTEIHTSALLFSDDRTSAICHDSVTTRTKNEKNPCLQNCVFFFLTIKHVTHGNIPDNAGKCGQTAEKTRTNHTKTQAPRNRTAALRRACSPLHVIHSTPSLFWDNVIVDPPGRDATSFQG